MNPRSVRLLGLALPSLVAGAWLPVAAAAEAAPAYSWLAAGYQWADVNYAVKEEGGEHDGIHVEGSLGLLDTGRFGVHLVADWFDGDFTGLPGSDLDSSSYTVGLGGSYALRDNVDLAVRARFVDVELEDEDDDGYALEGFVLAQVSDRFDVEAGYRYTDLSDSDISNTDVFLGVGYAVNGWLSLRCRGVVFDDDSGFELAARVGFGGLLGRDSLF